MLPIHARHFSLVMILLGTLGSYAEEPKQPAPKKESPHGAKSVEELAAENRASIVVVTMKGREGKNAGLGTGFVVDSNGIIATNAHVVGEGRAISVETSDGKKHDVIAVHAIDRARDLALIRIDAKNLRALPLGDSDRVKDGQGIVVLGNPQGLKFSVVSGVISAQREVEGASMLQLAIPVEQGNSGGPVLDLQGRVLGVVTMKSLVTANLGYAVPVNALKQLIAKPNPVAMEHWVTLGALDADEWKPALGSTWRQRAGRITVEGTGSGFGGRSLCIHQNAVPPLPYEISVSVKLGDERGAAGLLFHYDGDKHYGFYPTGGKLRLTRFEGPDVFSWHILEDLPTPHYKPGEWNAIKVRVAKDGITCFVNDRKVLESKDVVWTEGKAGLCKFRETQAEFKQFQVAKSIPSREVSAEEAKRILKTAEGILSKRPPTHETINTLAKSKGSTDTLRERAKELEAQAAKLRDAAALVHQQRVYDELATIFSQPEGKIDLLHAALLPAKLDNEELEVEAYRAEIDRMGKKLAAELPKGADDTAKLAALKQFFFEKRGFHGSRADYYNRSNSYLNEVIDDREGLPISLSILYIELGKRAGLTLVGIGAPGKFLVRHMPAKGEGVFIDVYDNGKTMTYDEAKQQIEGNGYTFREEQLRPVSKKQIVTRMMYNLLRVAQDENDMTTGLRYLDGILLLDPTANQERLMRSVLRYSKGMKKEALEDVEFLLEHPPEDPKERKRLDQLKQMLERELEEKKE